MLKTRPTKNERNTTPVSIPKLLNMCCFVDHHSIHRPSADKVGPHHDLGPHASLTPHRFGRPLQIDGFQHPAYSDQMVVKNVAGYVQQFEKCGVTHGVVNISSLF